MKLIALISLGLLACGLPAPPAPGPEGDEQPETPIYVPPDDDDEEEIDVDAGPRPDARPRTSRVLTQTTSNLIEPNVSISCSDDSGVHAENSYFRVFDLATAGVNSAFHVSAVEVGVDSANASGDGTQPVDVRLHTLTGDLQNGTLAPLATSSQNVVDTVATRIEFPFDAMVPAGSRLAVEVHTPDGSQNGDSFYIGANRLGQTAPGYLRAPECGDDQPTDFADIGFSDTHIIIDVIGE
jgi:hypothetical protein